MKIIILWVILIAIYIAILTPFVLLYFKYRRTEKSELEEYEDYDPHQDA